MVINEHVSIATVRKCGQSVRKDNFLTQEGVRTHLCLDLPLLETALFSLLRHSLSPVHQTHTGLTVSVSVHGTPHRSTAHHAPTDRTGRPPPRVYRRAPAADQPRPPLQRAAAAAAAAAGGGRRGSAGAVGRGEAGGGRGRQHRMTLTSEDRGRTRRSGGGDIVRVGSMGKRRWHEGGPVSG